MMANGTAKGGDIEMDVYDMDEGIQNKKQYFFQNILQSRLDVFCICKNRLCVCRILGKTFVL